MPNTVEAEFLSYAAKKLAQLCERIETCVAKLTPEQIWMRRGETQNAVGNLMLHLNGNVRQWILTGVDGQPNHRDRNSEFAARDGASSEELIRQLRETVDSAVRVIRTLPPERLTERTTIQGHDVCLVEVVFHVVEHFSGHAGQIIFATKAFTGEDLGFYSYLSQLALAHSHTP